MDASQRQFTAAGQTWTLTLSIGMARQIKSELGVDLPNAWKQRWAGLSALLADPWQFLDVLWTLVQQAATTRGIKRDAFEAGIDNSTIEQAAEALRWAVVGFIPRGEQAEVFAAEKIDQLAETALQQKLDDPETAAAVRAAATKIVAERLAKASGA